MKPSIRIMAMIVAVITIIISARFTIDLPLGQTIVPVTLQSLAVLCCAYFLKPIEALIATGIYIVLGVVGLPVFADGASGLNVLTGPTGGYLVGFILAAYGVASLKKHIPVFMLMLMGTALILFPGVLYLGHLKGMEIALNYGLYPLWKGAVVKIILGSLICFFGDKISKTFL